jgi:hypothetical protein
MYNQFALMETKVIALSSQDSVLAVRAKVLHADAPRLLLLWPRKGRVMTRRLDLVLVQRACRERGMQLALVTQDALVRAHAEALTIPVYEDETTARKRSWRRASHKSAAGGVIENEEHYESGYLENLQAVVLKMRPRVPGKIWVRILPLVIGLLAAAAMAGLFWPSAIIRLRMAGNTQAVTLAVAASPEVGTPNLSGSLPARHLTVTVEGQQTVPSTGSVVVPDQRAVGEVLFTNLTSKPVLAPVGTVVLTLGEPAAWFETTQAVEAPAGEDVRVAVRSLIPGSEGNVEAEAVRAFAGETGLYLAVTNPEAISGGSDRSSPAPAAIDARRLRSDLLDAMDAQASEKFSANLAEGEQLILATLERGEIIKEATTPELGSPSDTLELNMVMEYSAWVVNEADVDTLAQLVLDASLESGFTARPDTLVISPVIEPVMDGNRAVWEVHAVRQVRQIWEPDDVNALTNRTTSEAKGWLAEHYSLDGEPAIGLSPGWWPRTPFLGFRIKVEVE